MTAGLISSARRGLQSLALWLGLVALTVQGFAPLCLAGTAGSSSGQSIVICTLHGYQTITLDSDGKAVPAPSSDHQNSTCFMCVACHSPGGGLVAPQLASMRTPTLLARANLVAASTAIPASTPHSAYISRAPPIAPASTDV